MRICRRKPRRATSAIGPPVQHSIIFFGKMQPYSAVNHIGKVVEGLDLFQNTVEGD
ncbi:MAG: hypothetical protein AB9879_08400 [Methanothrix sp.]